MGIDPGFGSSPFGIVVTQFVDSQIQVAYAEEFERPDFNEMIDKVTDLAYRYGFTLENSRIFVDGANPSVIRSLKQKVGEDPNYEQLISYYKSIKYDPIASVLVIPVNFSQEHKSMLIHAKRIVEDGRYIAINPKFDKLIASLRTAIEKEGTLDKDATSFNDIFDAFRLALRFYLK